MMNIKIYQIALDKDELYLAFRELEYVKKVLGQSRLEPFYKKVYEGIVYADNLEEVYRIFNIQHPEGYTGRSMSVSDVVEVVDLKTGECTWHYCDSIGFTNVEFDPGLIGSDSEIIKKAGYIKAFIAGPNEDNDEEYWVYLKGWSTPFLIDKAIVFTEDEVGKRWAEKKLKQIGNE